MESSHGNAPAPLPNPTSPNPPRVSHSAERRLEATLFASRWLMAPFYLGLVVALAALLVVFMRELVHEIAMLPEINAKARF
jgi:uncharacterized membrane protein YqhA